MTGRGQRCRGRVGRAAITAEPTDPPAAFHPAKHESKKFSEKIRRNSACTLLKQTFHVDRIRTSQQPTANPEMTMTTATINEWSVMIDKSGVNVGLWIATATRDGMALTEYAKTRKRAKMLIEIAIEVEMENPWWKNAK